MSNTRKVFAAYASGILSSFAVSIALALIDLKFGLALYSFSLWLVLPVGALLCGLAAASGYYFGFKRLNLRPAKALLPLGAAISVCTLLLMYWLEYVLTSIDGSSVSQLVSFVDFLKFQLSHTSIHVGYRGHFVSGSGFEVGSFGYALAALHVIGFALGGMLVYFLLRAEAYCEDCSLYLKTKGQQTRYHEDANALTSTAQTFARLLQAGAPQSSLDVHEVSGSTSSTSRKFASRIEVKACSGCELHWLKFVGMEKRKSDWNDVAKLSFTSTTRDSLQFATTNSSV